MAKMPDMSKLKEKFNLQGIMDSVKSIMEPSGVIPKNLEGDPVAAKLMLIHASIEALVQLQEQQQREMTKINLLIASLYKDLEAKNPPLPPTPAS
jgi:hypothetical protein